MTNAGGPPTRNNGEKRLAKLSSASKMAAMVTVLRSRTHAGQRTNGRGRCASPKWPILPYSPNVIEGVFSEVAPALVRIHTIVVVQRGRTRQPCLGEWRSCGVDEERRRGRSHLRR